MARRNANGANGKRHATQQSLNGISAENVDDTHIFTLSQVYEGLLLKMGETVYDPGCARSGNQDLESDFNAARMPSVTASPEGRPLTAFSASFSL